MKTDKLVIGEYVFNSRLMIGSGKFSSYQQMGEVLKASQSEVITLAIRRINLEQEADNILNYIPEKVKVLPNTAGASNAQEAIKMAKIIKKITPTKLIKLEVINDNITLLPDNEESLKAIAPLKELGFTVLVYMNPDVVMMRKMEHAGADAIMPLGAMIGSNRGFQTKETVRTMLEYAKVPIIVDAGLGAPTDALAAMELGCSAVLLNTAIATSDKPELMASAFHHAVIAGRQSYLAKRGRVLKGASASSPSLEFLNYE